MLNKVAYGLSISPHVCTHTTL